jgi:hypothetical protein
MAMPQERRMIDFEPIPDFLKSYPFETSAERKAAAKRVIDSWRERGLIPAEKPKSNDYTMPRTIDAVGKALFKQEQRRKAEEMKAKMARLRELKARK